MLCYVFWSQVEYGIVCFIYYKGIQEAIDKIMQLDRGALMAKFDLSGPVYRCFPICESDRYFLEMYWEGNYYVNLALPFGIARAPNTFNREGDLLEWICGDSDSLNEGDIHHYYDGFLTL